MTSLQPSQPRVTFAAAVNNREILRANLLASPVIASGQFPLVIEYDPPSASRAYNCLLDRMATELVVFAHQDVYFPAGWEEGLLRAIDELEQSGANWGVLGLLGLDSGGALLGEIWDCSGRIGQRKDAAMRAVAIDELAIILRSNSGLRFDPALPGFHLYAADILLTARKLGLETYVIDCPVVHNCPKHGQLDRSWDRAYHHMRRKWGSVLPIPTLTMPITRTGWPIWRRRLGFMKHEFFHGKASQARHPDPAAVAREMGYAIDQPSRVKAAETGGCRIGTEL